MDARPGDDSREGGGFPSQTAWSTVLHARDRKAPDWKRDFERLVEKYWKPVYWYLVRRWKCPREHAADLTQEFFTLLFEDDVLKGASPERGRFRTFLKLKLRDVVIDDLRRRSAQKRGGGHAIRPLLDEHDEPVLSSGPAPDEEFDRLWAGCLLADSLRELQKRYTGGERGRMFEAFHACTMAAPPQTYREAAAALGIKETDVHNYLIRLRSEFREILMERVRDSVETADEAQEELNELLTLFGR